MRQGSLVASGALLAFILAGVSLAPISVTGQSGYQAPRTPWGEPDFQGIWTANEMHGVPNERPKEFAERMVGLWSAAK